MGCENACKRGGEFGVRSVNMSRVLIGKLVSEKPGTIVAGRSCASVTC